MIRIIGDVHGKINKYVEIASQADYSIQLGDLGFDYADMCHLDDTKHRVLAGNHDNYVNYGFGEKEYYMQPSHFLGDYGTFSMENYNFFFVRGEHSIDKDFRREGFDWFPEEQLSYAEAMQALLKYMEVKPDFVISHGCPESIIPKVSTFQTFQGKPIVPSFTSKLLEAMLNYHKPKNWLFGHYHKNFNQEIDGTRFVCLDELNYMDLT